MKTYILSHLWNEDITIEADNLQEAVKTAFILKNMSIREVVEDE